MPYPRSVKTFPLCPGSEEVPVEVSGDDGKCPVCDRWAVICSNGRLRKHRPMASPKKAVCKDCREQGVKTTRPADFPGPRCATHWRSELARRKLVRHARRIEVGFGLTDEQYWGLYEYQGGKCYMCKRATGATKRLAVDHDHGLVGCDHPPNKGCPRCVRSLLCGPCNQELERLGRGGLQRGLDVLGTDPPAQRFLRASNTS